MTSVSQSHQIYDRIADAFGEAYRHHVEGSSIAPLLRQYAEACLSGYRELKVELDEIERRVYMVDEAQRIQIKHDAEFLRQEWATWLLLQLLAEDHEWTWNNADTQTTLSAEHEPLTMAQVWAAMKWEDAPAWQQLRENTNAASPWAVPEQRYEPVLAEWSAFRRMQIVRSWLERVYKTLAPPVVATTATHRQHTHRVLAMMRTGKELPVMLSRVVMDGTQVDALDPDATDRDDRRRRHLIEADQELEDALLAALWYHLRSGDVAGARSLCQRAKQPWRAASLLGQDLQDDPALTPVESEAAATGAPVGNAFRTAWMLACRAVAQNARTATEAALYGLQCGSLEHIFRMCRDYEDYLWAHFCCLIEQRLASTLAARGDPDAESVLQFSTPLSVPGIFQALKTLSLPAVRNASREPLRELQELVVSCQWSRAVEAITQRACQLEAPAHLVRFAAHLALLPPVLAGVAGFERAPDAVQHSAVAAYVDALAAGKRATLLPLYAQRLLDEDDVRHKLGQFAASLASPVDQARLLQAAHDAGLDADGIARHAFGVVLLATEEAVQSLSVFAPVQPVDEQREMALQLLTMRESLYGLALQSSNELARFCFANRRTDAALRMLQAVEAAATYLTQKEQLTAEEAIHLRERAGLCQLAAFLKTMAKWTQQLAARPPAPGPLPRTSSTAEQIRQQALLKQLAAEQEEFQRRLESTAAEILALTVQGSKGLLCYEGGWLFDYPELPVTDEIAQRRQEQLAVLRGMYIPEVAFAVHRVLFDLGRFPESIYLVSDAVAHHRTRVAECFTREQLHSLMLAMRESALQNLHRGMDPLGLAE